MIVAEQILQTNLPKVHRNRLLKPSATWLLKGLLCEREINRFAQTYPNLQGLEFVEHVLDFFKFSFSARDSELDNIPTDGRLIVVANHPIGSLDGLALLKLLCSVRDDVKILANDMLQAVPPLSDLMIPVPVFNRKVPKAGRNEAMKLLYQHLDNDGVLIVFPAGEVSRLRPQGVRDNYWHTGFLKMARRAKAPVLPIHIAAQNSAWFYGASMVYKPLATLLLVQEMFRQQHRHIKLRIGEVVPSKAISASSLALPDLAKLFRRDVYRLGANKASAFKTYKPIARAESRKLLKSEVESSELLGQTADGKFIYLHRYQGNSAVLREIGRLREIAFRAVDEGTGKRRDLDNYDTWYTQLVLWDAHALEIAGAYRLGCAKSIVEQQGLEGLYSHSLFAYHPERIRPYIAQGLELGRSFVQPKYWGKRSLDYLWQGIGAFLVTHPQYRYLFGPVTMSASLPLVAQDALVQFFSEQFPDVDQLAESRTPFVAQSRPLPSKSACYLDDLNHLKHFLAHQGASIPTLYKQYADLCEVGGVRFLGFNVDADFANAVDGLVLVDIERLKPQKRARYIKKPAS
ncbi:GNAT family N-acyltransferase [Pseudidiomarina donghaiensis]|uniref:L-ornithine N(alpha)-acyltransferase n=1 Tax=Pseudidiomarina donghaiensis TaxID=519452 RepID=A0A432XL66_9GAMM|nr:GNAT family N-acyltransferase [Pseudidiomarina donghaiensis]RUO49445.1 GNAT family N-acetyltransferase [Pseudidiomarina donghaiensis]SFV21256.1 Putative hemolysin [Pseudidiomarina donghaiensis]